MKDSGFMSNSNMRVQTERLVLRIPCLEDTADVFSIHSNPETNNHNPAGPMKHLDEARERVAGWVNDWTRNGIGYWTVIEGLHNKVIGVSGVRVMEWSGRKILNLYYRYGPEAWGKGYATEVAQEALRAAQSYQPDLPIVSRTRPTNVPAMRVAERIGLHRRPDLDTEHAVYVSRW
ncbi:GNAT family N-acetyltransferase [Alicyclobacillus sp. ALC3]|uniref:GNAT family N-acetyltransferase n=1 Tax=Alicyclobacillus sp. ALC3 TaxID=2796143 RepID=UPI0023794343|nr:GNAT family N-acetyltransferase [Alicyclobacillus sp. ALC3]WDL95907.1 GNAT family N-acetyltransferase [Alicyclobacillus sp. ALC3]